MSEQKPEKVSWFKRKGRGIDTPTEEKLDTPEGVWWRCPECKKTTTTEEYKDKLWCCPACNYHTHTTTDKFEIHTTNYRFTTFNFTQTHA